MGEGFLDGLVYTDEQDQPVLFVGAWQLAEVHAAVDGKWATPGARLLALNQLSDELERRLKHRGINQVVTWFDEGIDRFKKRLFSMGWVESRKRSLHRRLR